MTPRCSASSVSNRSERVSSSETHAEERLFSVHRREIRSERHQGQRLRKLSLRLDLVAEDKVGSQSKNNEEDAEDDEVYVELCVFHVQ